MQVSHAIVGTEYGRTLIARVGISQGGTIWNYDTCEPTRRLTQAEIDALPGAARAMFTTYCWQVQADNPSKGTVAVWEGVTEEPESDPLNFIDHSCDPNMVFQGDNRLVARRDIKKGEPLTLEYATCDTTYARLDHCFCGSKDAQGKSLCRGRVTERDARDPVLRQKYRGQMRSCIVELVDDEDVPTRL